MLRPNRSDDSAYLKIQNLNKFFGDFQALDDVTLSIDSGELVCFLGPSGCGKTTLLRAIAGLDLQTSGVIIQDGKDVSNLPPSERDFGIVFQSYALFPNLTIEQNVAFGLENTGIARKDIDDRVEELLSLVDLPGQFSKYPVQLSGGQQQRVALARALAMSPGLLLLDEPLSALDAKVRVRLRHELKELQRKLGVTTVMVTHDQEEAMSMADRIVILVDGVVAQVGTPTEIYREPVSFFVADFIGETNRFSGTVADQKQLVNIGSQSLACAVHEFTEGEEIIAAIRPDDIIPHALGNKAVNDPDPIKEPDNTVEGLVEEMEFLGSFWRTRLSNPKIGENQIVADFSVNAVRRLAIEEGGKMLIEMPSERLKIYPPLPTKG